MPIDIDILCRDIRTENTCLILGSGSSIPSGGPSAVELAKSLSDEFKIAYDPTLKLSDIASLVEIRRTRRELVDFIKDRHKGLTPTGGILNIPAFDWSDIFTTNYDEIIEKSFSKSRKPIKQIASNFDIQSGRHTNSLSLFKFHGTLDQDRSTGHQSSMIITNEDYDMYSQYRELLFDRLLHETSINDVLVIGHSLADDDLNSVLNEAYRRKRKSGAPGKLYVLTYTPDVNRAALLEQRGFSIAFGDLDRFTAVLANNAPAHRVAFADLGDLFDAAPTLRPTTIDVSYNIQNEASNAIKLFNGSAATYGDIQKALVFRRDLSGVLEAQISAEDHSVAYILGPAGFGKTTIARQAIFALVQRGFIAWEHKQDYRLVSTDWIKMAHYCNNQKINAVLFVDNSHSHLPSLNDLVDYLFNNKIVYFRLLLSSSPPQWHPRNKTPSLYKVGVEHVVKRLSHNEVGYLLDLFDREPQISNLVEKAFAGFSRPARLRRLTERCQSDMFVCMKNIFGFDQLDDIILKEYGGMTPVLQDVYRTVSAMEASNIRAHRQLIMRVLGIDANFISAILDMLSGVVSEHVVDRKGGIYAWKGRHIVVSEIILKNKYYSQDDLYKLYENVIDFINPTYEIEQETINEMCDISNGIGRIHSRSRQNVLYRKLISCAPAQRVPRHRLIYNLIDEPDFEQASNEIRIFEKDLKADAPLIRYKAMINIRRAKTVVGLMDEDRLVILMDASKIVEKGLLRYKHNKTLYSTLGEIGLDIFELSGDDSYFNVAMTKFTTAAKNYLDPEMPRLIAQIRSKADSLFIERQNAS